MIDIAVVFSPYTMRRRFLGLFALASGTVFLLAGSAAALCPGDCNENGVVTVDELTRGVQMALTAGPTAACTAVDTNSDGNVRINELVGAVYAALNGCPQVTIGLVLSQPVNVSNTPTLSGAASISRDGALDINVVWEESGNDILFSRSIDGGGTFSAPVYVMDPNGSLGSKNAYSSGQMKVVSPSGAVHVAWTIFDEVGGGAEVFYARADKRAATFSPPLMISTNDGVNSIAPSIAADVTDSLGIVWADSDLNTGQEAIYYSGSVGSGSTFSVPVRLANSGECPSIALSSGNIYVAWTAGAFGQGQIFFSRSIDSGDSFSTPIVVDNYPEQSWCPQIGVDAGGGIYAIWEEGAAFIDRKIMLSRSVDKGLSFSSPMILSAPATDSSCPSLAIDNSGQIFTTWTTFVSSELDDSFLAVSSDNGDRFSAPLKIPPPSGGAGCYAIIAGMPNQIGLAWNTPPALGSFAEIFYRTGQVSP